MSLLDTILNSQNGAPVQQMARSFGLDESDVNNVLQQFLPALTNGVKRNVNDNSSGGLDGLLGALNNGGHDRYLDEPDALSQASSQDEGNHILGHLLGSKEVSRELASRTAQNTGLDSNMLKQMLPLVANLVMGSLSKQNHQGNLGLGQSSAQTDSLSPLMSMLDSDGDGSVIDDVLGLAAKFLR